MRLVAWFALLTTVVAGGCARQTPQDGDSTLPRQAPVLRPADNYWPAAAKPRWFDLDFGGEAQTAQAITKHRKGTPETTIELTSRGQVLGELYHADENGVAFAGAGGDRFNPPIALIEYGRAARETRRWEGLNETGGDQPLRAVARVTTSQELTRLPIGTLATVKVTVSVALPDQQTGQDMTFWFAPGEGLVKATLYGYTRSARAGASR